MPVPHLVTLFGVLAVVAAPSAPANPPDPQSAIQNPRSRIPPPEWLKDARWYMIDVPFFRNGDPTNDPSWVVPWGKRVPPSELAVPPAAYGGDLQGLREKIPYLKDLGVNAVVLKSVFTPAWRAVEAGIRLGSFRHVDETIGVPTAVGGDPEMRDESYTPSDRLFLKVVGELQAHNMKVVVALDGIAPWRSREVPETTEAALYEINKRWLAPEGEDVPCKGIDGWLVYTPEGEPAGLWTRWRKQLHGINPESVLIGTIVEGTALTLAWVRHGPLDAAASIDESFAIHRFFLNREAGFTGNHFLSEIARLRDRIGNELAPGMMSELVLDVWPGNARTTLSFGLNILEATGAEFREEPATDPLSEAAINRRRLAYVFHAFAMGAPLLYCGEEVSFNLGSRLNLTLPMPWLDLPPPAVPPREYRGDLRALIRNLNLMRERYAPLRRGDFKPLLADDERKLLAFARTLPGDEVVLVINHGAEKQRVTLPCAKPGQLVAVLTPQLRPLPVRSAPDQPPALPDPATVKDLRVGGSRQFADGEGNVSFWVDPMGARVVLVNEVEPRRDRP